MLRAPISSADLLLGPELARSGSWEGLKYLCGRWSRAAHRKWKAGFAITLQRSLIKDDPDAMPSYHQSIHSLTMFIDVLGARVISSA